MHWQEQTVEIVVKELATGWATYQIPAKVCGGLAVHHAVRYEDSLGIKKIVMDKNFYRISHMQSGLHFGPSYLETEEQAIALAEKIVGVIDWTRDADTVRAMMQGQIQERLKSIYDDFEASLLPDDSA